MQKSLQAFTLCTFTALHTAHRSLRQALVLCLGDDEFAPAVALAVLGLGGTCLTLDSDQRRLQTAGRLGAIDFTVSSMTEALRILKNEVRKGTSVSVGLLGVPEALIQELLHRGVQPDVTCMTNAATALLEPFRNRGSLPVFLPPELPSLASRWQMRCDEAMSLKERRGNDARMLIAFEKGTEAEALNLRWLETASRLFPRDRQRMYWSTTETNGWHATGQMAVGRPVLQDADVSDAGL